MIQTFSATEVASLIGVAVGSVLNWVRQGELKAGQTPGGHKRIRVDDLVEFLRRQGLPVPRALEPNPPRALVVDDEPGVAKWVATVLGRAHPNWQILQANDGFSAGEIIAT
ncbi:MAG: helix-turn-helix domain-containing protein, partial [Phycisphaerae bacterium]|nr:helix-turn-helix domain-containing protein [Phycisphaerae bacterium]